MEETAFGSCVSTFRPVYCYGPIHRHRGVAAAAADEFGGLDADGADGCGPIGGGGGGDGPRGRGAASEGRGRSHPLPPKMAWPTWLSWVIANFRGRKGGCSGNGKKGGKS